MLARLRQWIDENREHLSVIWDALEEAVRRLKRALFDALLLAFFLSSLVGFWASHGNTVPAASIGGSREPAACETMRANPAGLVP